ncbi:MAG: hypothetical protein IJF62_01095 [Firmicutes bacterium]|nr:hypothetical protein [Bacillota bacterium]MBQ3111457.1 hypothetical protein [Bacillota bacterium]MBR6824436.1 hypothetical protein [Bacillota bacterium]
MACYNNGIVSGITDGSGCGSGFSCIINLIIVLIVLQFLSSIILGDGDNGIGCGC